MAKISARGDTAIHRLEVEREVEDYGKVLVKQVVFTKQGRVLRKSKWKGDSWSSYNLIKKVPVESIPARVARLKEVGWKELKA